LFAALNANTQTGNTIIVSITADVTTEDGANALNAGAWTSITITPSGARTISGAFTGSLIDFNGADNVTINGLNTGGNSLIISNTTAGVANTIRFYNDATNNTITKCSILGAGNTTATGVIYFGTGATTGNDNNTISNCNITAAGANFPSNGIISNGTSAAVDNSGITISGNNIYDYFHASTVSRAINIDATNANSSNGWTISNNKFYQTATRTYTAAILNHIIFLGTGDGFLVSGNTFGYASSTGTGVYTSTSTLAYRMIIIANNGAATLGNSIQGNTFAGFSVTSANTTGTGSLTLSCIHANNTAKLDIGTVTGNTFGATTGTGSINVIQTGSGGGFVGISPATTGAVNISNNTFGAIAVTGSAAANALVLNAINISGLASSMIIANNTIGNTTANNMVAGTLGTTTGSCSVAGIAGVSTPTSINYNNNTIQNLTGYGVNTGGFTKGIYTAISGTTTAATIYNNTIRNLLTYSALVGHTSALNACTGIQFAAGLNATIYGNTIYELNYGGTSNTNVVVSAIALAAASQTKVYNNKIYAIRNNGKSNTAITPNVAVGIVVRGGAVNDSIYNNMISLGIGDTTNAAFTGIMLQMGSGACSTYVYHNTVNIGGSVTNSSGTMCTAAFLQGDYGTTIRLAPIADIRNNIFTNTRTGGLGKHIAIGNNINVVSGTISTGWTSNNNFLYSAVDSTQGWWLGNKNFTNWKSSSASDALSYSSNVYTYTNAAAGDLHINMGTSANQIESQGSTTLGIATDFDGDARPGPVGSVNGGGVAPDLGADEWDGLIAFSCTTPSANSVNASVTAITCLGSTTNLSLANAVTGTGNTYQWQLSTNGTTYNNISGATLSTYTATPVSTNNYYRCIITCANGPSSLTATPVLVTIPTPLAAGTYTINSGVATGGTNYISFTDAFTDLACKGIAGPVVINVAGNISLPYTEQVVLNQVAGASATNTITINGNGRTLSFNSTTAATRSGIILNGADYVTIDNLKIDGSAGTYGWGVLLTGGADNNTISNCTITVSSTNVTSTNHYGIVISASTTTNASSGANGSNNTFTGNTISGGYYGISLYGSSTLALYNSNNTVTNNTIRNAYLYSVYCIYQKNLNISGNDISRPTRTTTSTTAGVYLTTGGGSNVVSKNRIHNMFDAIATNTSTAYGIYVATDGGLGTENVVSNNLITFTSGTGTGAMYGIYNSGGAYMLAYHNTIVISDAASTAGVATGLYQTTAVAGIQVRNNIVTITRGGTGIKRCVHYNTTTTTITSNNNDFYLNSAGGADNAIGQWGTTTFVTLNNWTTANSNAYDANSFSVNPQFVDPTNGDYTPNSGAMDNGGTNVGITTDILGNSRDNTTPDLGAIEFTGAGCQDPPTPGTATSSSAIGCYGVSFTLDVTGASTGAGQTYQWQDSVANGSWTDIGTASNFTSYTTSQIVSKYYRASITCSGGTTVYSTPVYVITTNPLNGNYTINKNAAASSTNFTSLNNAIASLNCGVSGPVVFDVVTGSGPYNERITIPAISGVSATNTITFNGNGNTIYNKLGSASARTAITLNGADYITINNFTINVADSTYGWGVLFTNAADNNTISNCIILTSTTDVTSGNDYPIVFSGSTTSAVTAGNNGNYNTITGCTLTGGYYNVSLYGNSTTGGENIGNTISSCTMTDAYVYSMYILYQKDLTISKNNISRPTRTSSSTLAGVYLSTSSGGGYLIEKNIIHDMNVLQPTSTSTCYGVYIAADAASYSNPNRIQNNLIFNLGGNGILYGIYNSTSNFNQIYHNTVALNDNTATSGASYGIYQTGAATVDIKNNNVIVSRTGTGVKRCLYFGTTTSTITCDYNNLLMSSTGAGDTVLAQFGTTGTFNFNNLTAWKTANGGTFDQNSYSILPSFIDVANNNYTPTSNLLNNKGTNVGVTKDILDTTRSNTTPDIGAYEFDIPTCSGTPNAGTVVVLSTIVCSGNNLRLDASGNTTGIGITYQWQSSLNNSTWTNFGASLESTTLDTTQTATKYYRLAATCSGSGITSYSSSVLITTPALVSGTFTIDANSPTSGTNFANFADAVSYISCGINGPVVFNVETGSGPYNEQVIIPAINGTSAINTITFNGNGNTVSFNATLSGSRAVITLNGSDYVTLNNLNINGSAGTYGWGVFMTNQADYNTVSNCTINVGANATTTNFAGVVMSASFTSATTTGTVGSNNTITNNNIIGGYYGITACGGSANLGMNNQFTNNNLVDQYLYPSYNTYQSGALISNNDIYKLNRTTYSTGYGCYLTTGVTNSRFEKNKIHNVFGTATTGTSIFYGFYVAGDGTAGNENKIINNLIYDINNNGTNYGVYNTTGAYMKVYHNTIIFDGTAATTGTTYGIYQTGAVAGIDLRNNSIFITRSGTGIKRCLHFVTTTSTITSNNNNLYLSAAAGIDNNIGTFGNTAYATLTNWKTANSNAFDQNSVSVDPQFVNISSGNLIPRSTSFNGVGATNLGVTTDIVGNNRTLYFTPGAYEVDNALPVITNSIITNSCAGSIGASSIDINGVNITDASGISTTGANMPKVYFRKGNSGGWSALNGTMTSGTSTNSNWNFSVPYTSFGGANTGDIINYFIVAQDLSAYPNVGSNTTDLTASSVSAISVYPTTGNSVNITAFTPSVSISTATNSICSGSNTTFTATGSNGGSSPSYQWKKNGVDAGSGSSITFLSNTLSNGDVISCILTANNACQTSATATSNAITITVKQSPAVAQITNGIATITSASLCALGTTYKYYCATPYGSWSSSNPSVASVTGGSQAGVVTANTNGTATISYGIAATNGCISTSSVTVTVAQQSAPTAITGTNSLCVNATSALSSTAPIGTTGVWSSSNDRGIISVGGVYTAKNAGTWGEARYTVTNASGCKAFASYAITVNPTPVVPTITYAPGTTSNPQAGAPTGSFCVGKKFRVVATPNVPAGVWSATGAASFAGYDTVIINAVGAGSIKYTYTSAAGCVNSRTMSASGYTCAARGISVSGEGLVVSGDFTLYPNPAKGFINLNVETLIGAGSIVVTDLYGKTVKTQNLSMGTNTVNISNLSKGMYFVSTITNEGKTTKKLVVE
jgi:hypothetical protein